MIEIRNAIFYFASIALTLFFFIIALSYMMFTISVNAARTSDLAGVESSIQRTAEQLAKNPKAEDIPHIRDALSDLNAQKVGHQKTIDFGDDRYWDMTFTQCAIAFNANCFHRNSSWMNTIYLGIASGLLGVCLFFFISIRTDAISTVPAMWNLGTLISLICLIPTGAIIGLLTLFLLKGAKGAILTPVSDVVQVESPFGVAFACTIAAFFSDRILAALSRLMEHFGLTATT